MKLNPLKMVLILTDIAFMCYRIKIDIRLYGEYYLPMFITGCIALVIVLIMVWKSDK